VRLINKGSLSTPFLVSLLIIIVILLATAPHNLILGIFNALYGEIDKVIIPPNHLIRYMDICSKWKREVKSFHTFQK